MLVAMGTAVHSTSRGRLPARAAARACGGRGGQRLQCGEGGAVCRVLAVACTSEDHSATLGRRVTVCVCVPVRACVYVSVRSRRMAADGGL